MSKVLSRLHFQRSLPSPKSFGTDAVLLFDRNLHRFVPGFREWVSRFPCAYALSSGESLKGVHVFAEHIERIVHATRELSPRRMTMVVAGGGSVGDFGGFVASIYKRGVRLVHVPTTWLAAIDSSHGGKTALNVAGGKNQIGTFYPASDIFLVQSILAAQPEIRAHDACGELGKIALLDGGAWVKRMEATKGDPGQLLWRFLPDAVKAKYKVVARDPREETGHRQILNLGHTLGHVFEAEMGLAHGEAITQGMFFALGWSFKRGLLSLKTHGRARNLLQGKLGLETLVDDPGFRRARPTVKRARALLLQDKKRETRGDVTFIFLEAFGRSRRESVRIDDLLDEAKEQGWLR